MEHNIYNAALVTHVIGITIMAGATFIDFALFARFKRLLSSDKSRAIMSEEIMQKLQRFMGIGMLVIILSGVTMMAYLHQVWGQQTWFRIKMGILLLIIINGLGLRRILGARLKKIVAKTPEGDADDRLRGVEKQLTTVQVVQVLFFIIIFVLSIFKFN